MTSPSVRQHVAASLRQVLRPIVRQAIHYGVSYPALVRLLKQLYVDVADADFALPFKRGTDSRIALLTGISRRDIAALRGRRTPQGAAVEDSIATHVIGRWMAAPPFATPDGTPRLLAYEADDAARPSFSSLVRSLAGDIPVRAVLDELIRLGSVRLLADGDVELVREARIPAGDPEAMLAILGSDPAELYATIAHNIENANAAWLQRKVAYANIGADALDTLRAESRQIGEDFVRRADALLSSYDRDRNAGAPGGTTSRVAIGVYYFEETGSGEVPVKPRKKRDGPPGRIKKKSRK